MLVILRIVGVFNAAIWIGSAVFFTFGVAQGIFSAEMKRIFGDYYVGIIGQQLIGRYFAVNLICCAIALVHFFAEIIYTGRPFRRLTFGLLLGVLAIGLLEGYLFSPKLKEIHRAKYLGPVAERAASAQQFKRLHATSSVGNLLVLIAVAIYTWQVANPPDPTRFVSAQKFRG